MRRLIGTLTSAILFGVAPASGYADSTDEVLKRFFPDRDLSKAVFKIVDHANGYYAIGDSLEITKDGCVRTTNAVLVWKVGGPNQPARYSSHEASQVLIQFAKPLRQPSDLAGNKIGTVTTEK